ncbi:uncharacterized protein N7479_010899 [Penicillium vulpinum]|uniref:Tetraspanin Tsp3 n=1 Tax=Penicillium vulpinum TaxID=29845 RepID=A0A1V6RZG3_9EURO|nr:uncharacterized protein N7479_010899 [Penicillium vulpinum]KAJ5952486.1 hypothetical protein N7479_010899 [Penicillium vulpinum]OQE07181.1 hypothetical protein PENVUL_c014G06491 [Penicillium vulpinum]
MTSFKVDAAALLHVVFIMGGIISLVLGAMAWARTSALHLPLPTWIPAVATVISPITVLTLIFPRVFSTRLNNETARNGRWSTISDMLNQAQTIIATIVATAALAYLFPDRILSCNLDQQWQEFFKSKNSQAIRSIQDEFRCCGLRSLHDRAWPFKDRNHGDNACETQLGYQSSCFAPWREYQQRTSWMIFVAAFCVFAAKIAFYRLSSHRTSWMSAESARRTDYQRISHQTVQDEEDNEDGIPEETRRTLLPQSNTNHWEVD